MINIFKRYILKTSILPVSRKFGFDRGKPIDRYYIEKFLSENKSKIRGVVMEVGDLTYTNKFGGRKVTKSLVLNKKKVNDNDLVGDLETGEGLPNANIDCFILTQTLPFIFGLSSAVKNCLRVLKPGGYLLLTVPGITQISRYDMDRWGHYWNFTDLSLQKLFEEFVPKRNIIVKTYGNVKAACFFLYGLSQEEIDTKELDYRDEDYQVIITAVIKKPSKK